MKTHKIRTLFLAVIALPAIAFGQPPVDPDPNGVLLKPIPDKLVVLTFDDGCASGFAVVAPILKSLGFNGTFYVCDFDSFKTRKDWYLTWRQMKAMAEEGFEIGNHTVGHWGGLGQFLDMEDELLANNVPKPTTVCWPVYDVNWSICPALTTNGYTFGRGGHERPYRPTVDNPFDVPSFSITDGLPIENFIKHLQQACQGRVVVLTFHGVPDMEHPPVSLEPATFKAMMQYCKDNNYQCIALRDMAKYIDVAKAANLPRTANDAKGAPPFLSIKDDKPFVAVGGKDIRSFNFPGLPPARISKTAISVTVPYGTDVTALAPKITTSAGATIDPASGTSRDFTKPQTYSVTAQDGSTKTYSVTVSKAPVSRAKDMLTFVLQGVFSNAVSGNRISVSVPATTDVSTLVPTFTLSPLATAVPPSGTARDFTRPQSYTITAQDGSSQVCTVTVVKISKPNAFVWSNAESGNWSDGAKWSDNLGSSSAPNAAGQPDYFLSFNQIGAVTNDLNAGFLLNQLVLGDRCGGMIVRGKGITFTKESAAGILPVIQAGKCRRVDINVPLNLLDDLTVNTSPDKDPNCFISFNEVISGPRVLILKSSGDPDVARINFHDVHFGILQINNANTYRGGTFINGGKINVRKADGLGTGVVTLDNFGTMSCESTLANAVIINQGTLFHCALSGPVKLNGIASFIGNCRISGGMSGAGGFTMLGINGTYLNMVPGGTVTLLGTNTYTGPTTVFPGTLIVKKAAGLYSGDTAKWTPANITIHKAASLRLNVGGPGEFTGGQVGTLMGNLTRVINQNGLMGGSFLTLDTANTTEPVTVSANLSDSKGPGGGAFLFRKCGAGAMRLSGNNAYTGQSILESGTLIVSSLNSFTKGKGQTSSSLGAPMDIEAGEIVFGDEGKDGDCALIYTGTGETSDRVMNLAGKNSTVTFDQSGNGLLKLTSTFVISGYGANKTISLKGDTAGTGEIAGNIVNPHDRAGKATTSVTKSGTGTWTLSGTNTYTGPTKVTKGTLSLANTHSLGDKTDVSISDGATLDLNFKGEMRIRELILDGKPQPAGAYSAANTPKFIKGTGGLRNLVGDGSAAGLTAEPAKHPKMPVLKPLFDYPVRDTSVCLGPDGIYYLIGTTGHPTWWTVNEGVRMWKSKDLKTWDALGLVWSFEKNMTWQKGRLDKDGKIANRALWAPELHYFKGTFWIAYCMNYGGTGILKSQSGKPEGPYLDVKQDGPLTGEIDASLFANDDGSVYFVWQNGRIARMKDDLSGFAEQPRQLKPSNAGQVGFEGAFITKINGRYHLICADFMKWDGKTSTYDCMAASSENIYGPYGERYLAILGGGHNMLFKDKEGNWWSTYFGNDDWAPFRERPAILRIEIDKDNRIKPVLEK